MKFKLATILILLTHLALAQSKEQDTLFVSNSYWLQDSVKFETVNRKLTVINYLKKLKN